MQESEKAVEYYAQNNPFLEEDVALEEAAKDIKTIQEKQPWYRWFLRPSVLIISLLACFLIYGIATNYLVETAKDVKEYMRPATRIEIIPKYPPKVVEFSENYFLTTKDIVQFIVVFAAFLLYRAFCTLTRLSAGYRPMRV